MSCSVFCCACNALNCAICAAMSVLLSGDNGSCSVICVTSSFKKSAWLRVCDDPGVWLAEVGGVFVAAATELMFDIKNQAQDSQPCGLDLFVLVLRERAGFFPISSMANSPESCGV